jgi:hypothetical protein
MKKPRHACHKQLLTAEPTGVEFSVTNFLPLPWTLWHTVSKRPSRARSQ